MKTLDQIAGELQGYDPQALSADQVQAFLRLLAPDGSALAAQTCAVPLALERIVATDVISPVHVPPHDNSAMDGYAFDGSVLSAGGAIRLRCVGTALAGPVWQGQLQAGECVKIMTGAVMPAGLNTVVPYADDHYRKARPKLGLAAKEVLKIDGAFGFHPVRRDANSASSTSRSSRLVGTSIRMRSPSFTKAMGPPSVASGAT